jgi:CRISPR-associated protein Cmr2
MSEYLLAISLGPVQGFIAAARKTRDLWFGSYLLSDIARQTAKRINEQNGATLIFPGVETPDKLNENNFSVANVILAVVSGNPQEIAKQAEKAANDAWKTHVENAKQKVEEYGNNVLRQDIWNKQKDNFVEFYAAWVPYNASDYQRNRKRVMRLLAGRKACRDFVQEQSTDDRLPKSSLDGARDTVLQEKLPNDFRKHLHIRNGEQLDLIGIVKRFGGGRKKFPSLGEIAVNPILKDRAAGFSADEIDDEDNEFEKCPYLAVICADGDKMGAAISSLDSPEKHKQFSIALSAFSQAVPGIVKAHYGECVYAGGDDVLAFVPVDGALPCARELSESFKKKLKNYDVSLSVGVVIGHYHEMLETILEFARKAEKKAKGTERNGLAISMYHRSNAECSVREQWTHDMDKRIMEWAVLFKNNVIPRKFPYDLRTLKDLYNGVNLSEKDLMDCLKKQLYAAAKHKQINEMRAQELYVAFGNIRTIGDAEKLVNEMLIAQIIGEVEAKGGNNA